MPDNGSNILVGWKDIAAYLGVCVDTARSYEKDGLPVLRYRRKVRAVKSEIDKWITVVAGKYEPDYRG
jgi:hypothetical protein